MSHRFGMFAGAHCTINFDEIVSLIYIILYLIFFIFSFIVDHISYMYIMNLGHNLFHGCHMSTRSIIPQRLGYIPSYSKNTSILIAKKLVILIYLHI
jgi:hypothetical protein